MELGTNDYYAVINEMALCVCVCGCTSFAKALRIYIYICVLYSTYVVI